MEISQPDADLMPTTPPPEPDIPDNTPDVMPDAKLNQRQINFCHAYIKGISGTQAATIAGYTKGNARSTASVLVHNQDILDYIAKLNRKQATIAVATVTQRKQKLTEIMQDDQEKSMTKINAIAELNKMENVYSDAPKLTVPIQINYVDATPENAEELQAAMQRDREN